MLRDRKTCRSIGGLGTTENQIVIAGSKTPYLRVIVSYIKRKEQKKQHINRTESILQKDNTTEGIQSRLAGLTGMLHSVLYIKESRLSEAAFVYVTAFKSVAAFVSVTAFTSVAAFKYVALI